MHATQTITDLLGQLHRELELSSKAYRAGGDDATRSSVELALGSVLSFLTEVFDRNSEALLPLRRLSYALHDLDRGRVDPFLRPKKIDHRPPNSLREEGFIAFCAAAMELFVEGGISRGDAARRVAHSLNASGYKIGNSNRITPRQAEKWRDKMRAGSRLDDPAVERFRRILEQCHRHFQSSEAAAKEILGGLPLVAPPENSSKALGLTGNDSCHGLGTEAMT